MTAWTRIAPMAGMGLTESWIFRPDAKPLCAIRRDTDNDWKLDLLCLGGISCSVMHVSGQLTLEHAKVHGEAELMRMGHKWTGAGRVKSERQKEGKGWLTNNFTSK